MEERVSNKEQDPNQSPVDGPGAGIESQDEPGRQSSYDKPEGPNPAGEADQEGQTTQRTGSGHSGSESPAESSERADEQANIEK